MSVNEQKTMNVTDSSIHDTIGASAGGSGLNWLIGQQIFWVVSAAIVAFVTMSFLSDVFATQQNLFNVTRNFAFVGIIALGMTAVIITGGIDLSVGSVLALTGMVIGMSMNQGMSFWLAAPLAIAVSLAVGAFNGVLIAFLGFPPFVVTLGMLSIARSLAMVLSNNRMVYEFGPDQATLLKMGGGFIDMWVPFLGSIQVPIPVLFLIGLTIATAFALRATPWGRHIYAIGGSEHAAILTGIPVRMTKVSVYMFASFCAGLAGILEVGWLGTITTGLGQGMELTVIAASVIGGANLMGGVGTAVGAVVGAALIELIRNALTLLKVSTFWQGTFVGSFIIIAVLFDRIRSQRADD